MTLNFYDEHWKLEIWKLRAVRNYSWDKILEYMQNEEPPVGWRKVRSAVRKVNELMLAEVTAQLTVLSKIRRLDIIDFKTYYKREGDELSIQVPVSECDILFGLVYGYIAATELKKKQHLETVSHSIRRKTHRVMLKIVDELATESSSPKRRG